MSDEPNEILATVAAAKVHEEAGAPKAQESLRARHWPLGRIGLGVGIGSAALAAAVLFANRKSK